MCDTIVATGEATAGGVTLFGKNSDRHPNEPHHLLRVPRTSFAPGSQVQCTYLAVPQVEQTWEVLLAKPFWLWGAEMGVNEHGLAIGNEAVFTRLPYEKKPGLIGIDLLRLGLERARNAREAVGVITSLLEEHGQGGNCGFPGHMEYFNSFLLADPTGAWVLETAGRQWAAQQVRGVRAISNRLTLGSEWDLASKDLVAFAVNRGWCKGRGDFHFARCYSDWLFSTFSFARQRNACTTSGLGSRQGRLEVEDLVTILRGHGPSCPARPEDFSPADGVFSASVCQHYSWGPVRISQTTGSMVSHLAPEGQTHFLTATSSPCTSVFKPLWLGAELPDTGPVPTQGFDARALWWRHERLHRATLRNFRAGLPRYALERDALEREFLEGALGRRSAPVEQRARFAGQCFDRAREAEESWTERVLSAGLPADSGPLYARAWAQLDREAGMPPAKA